MSIRQFVVIINDTFTAAEDDGEEMNDDIPPRYGVAVRKIDKTEADKTSAEIVRFVLREHLRGLKEKLDPAKWVNSGWEEVECICGSTL